jgi:heme/copper-type cytochrome/quinol oxidase subunit 2
MHPALADTAHHAASHASHAGWIIIPILIVIALAALNHRSANRRQARNNASND